MANPLIETWYDLRSSLSLNLGEALIHWSENAQGYPIGGDYDEYVSLLRSHGETLIAYAHDEGEDDSELALQAQAVYHWIADNLDSLWD